MTVYSFYCKAVARGGPVVPGSPFKICALHFMFAPPVAAYIQYCS